MPRVYLYDLRDNYRLEFCRESGGVGILDSRALRALWPLRRTSMCRKVNASERLTEPTLTRHYALKILTRTPRPRYPTGHGRRDSVCTYDI